MNSLLLSQSARQSLPRSSGYTLIELMVVIAIMGLITSFVLPYLPGDRSDQLREQANRFESLVSYAQSQSVLQSQDMGLIVDGDKYSFVQRVKAGWEIIEEEPLNPQTLESFLKQTLYVEDVEVLPPTLDKPEDLVPSVLFFSSGEVAPFTYELALSAQNYIRFEYDLLGEAKKELISAPE